MILYCDTVKNFIDSCQGFGDGEIIKIDKTGKYLTVKFEVGEKKFACPDGFTKGFLNFKD